MKILSEKNQAQYDILTAQLMAPAALHDLQQKRLKKIILHARRLSPFYRKLYSNLPENTFEISALPHTQKLQIRRHFNDVFTDPRINRPSIEDFISDPQNTGLPYLNQYLVSTTAGTTGDPDIFISDSFSANIAETTLRLRAAFLQDQSLKRLAEVFFGLDRYAIMDITGGPYSTIATIERMRKKNPNTEKRFQLFSVSNSIQKQVAELNEFQPTALGGYPSSILQLAKEKLTGNLNIKPDFLIFTGESVTSAARTFIEKTFDCHSYEHYGSAENQAMAMQCKEGWLHYNSDWFILEPVTQNYSPVPKGEASYTVLVTNLANRVMPLIRYDQGDSILLKPSPCECGSHFPAMRTMGRKEELLKLRTDNGSTLFVPSVHLISLVEEIPGTLRAQIIQEDLNLLEFRLIQLPHVDTKEAWPMVCKQIYRYLELHEIHDVKLTLSEEPPLYNPSSAKCPLVMSGFEKRAKMTG